MELDVVNSSNQKVGAVAVRDDVFGGRVNEGVASGGRVILNPTNGSSYTLTVLQTQQLASSRVRRSVSWAKYSL